MRRRPRNPAALIAVLIAVAVSIWYGGQAIPPDRPVPPHESIRAEIPADERPQLEATLRLIEQGGPFPYRQDGTVFQNRERRLPEKPRGYYREYTVRTPGAKNRGARRVVTGAEGERWYTRDHYRTFIRLDNEGHASRTD